MNIYRPAQPAAARWNLAKTAMQTAVFWGVFLFALPLLLTRLEDALGIARLAQHRTIGVVVFASCGALGLSSGAIMAAFGGGTPLPMDTARALVVRGPYRLVRNPMAVAGIGQGVAVAVWFGSWTVLLYALAGGLLWHFVLRPGEERDLLRRFGDGYARYRRDVPLWLPRWPR